jgi:hypothetical protein
MPLDSIYMVIRPSTSIHPFKIKGLRSPFTRHSHSPSLLVVRASSYNTMQNYRPNLFFRMVKAVLVGVEAR